MSGNKEQKKTNNMIDTNYAQQQQEHGEDREKINTQTDSGIAQSGESRAGLETGLRNYAGTNVDVSGGRNMDSGAYKIDSSGFRLAPKFDESQASFRDFIKSGGYDQGAASVAHPLFQEQISSPEIQNRYRANGTYDEFARTGGLSDQDRANLRTRATSGVPAMFSRLRDEADRGGMVNPYGPGRDAIKARLARDSAKAIADANLNAEIGIRDMVNQGRQWGAAGMTGAESSLQGMRQGAGLGLDTSARGIQGAVQSGKMFGTQGMYNTEKAINDYEQNNIDRALGIETGNVNRRLGVDAGNIDRGLEIDTGNRDARFTRDTNVMGIQGDLAQSDRDYVSGLLGLNLAERGSNANANLGYTNQRVSNNPRRDWLGTIMGLGGTAAGLMTGAGAMR